MIDFKDFYYASLLKKERDITERKFQTRKYY